MNDFNPIHRVANVEVKDRDFSISISVNTLTAIMHIFKYDSETCAYECFSTEETDQACTWISLPLS